MAFSRFRATAPGDAPSVVRQSRWFVAARFTGLCPRATVVRMKPHLCSDVLVGVHFRAPCRDSRSVATRAQVLRHAVVEAPSSGVRALLQHAHDRERQPGVKDAGWWLWLSRRPARAHGVTTQRVRGHSAPGGAAGAHRRPARWTMLRWARPCGKVLGAVTLRLSAKGAPGWAALCGHRRDNGVGGAAVVACVSASYSRSAGAQSPH